jgi:intraflagellar transport protein 52
VQRPSIPILSTGAASYPLSRPVAAVYEQQVSIKIAAGVSCVQGTRGKVMALGSGFMFADEYLDKEENAKLFDVLFQWLTTDNVQLNAIDAEDPDVSSRRVIFSYFIGCRLPSLTKHH